MKAIVLAAGYATRLRPLTNTIPKPLLPLAGRPMVDYIYEKITAVAEVDAVHLVTNHRFAPAFEAWARALAGRLEVRVHDDGTLSNEDRLGAIGDLRFTLEQGNLTNDDLLVIAGDSLFDYDLGDYVAYFRKKEASAVALYECPDRELVKQYSVVEVDDREQVTSFIEKPEAPQSNLVGTAMYIYHRHHLPWIERYLAEGNSPDQPGRLVAWLHRRAPVFGYRFSGGWFDVGSPSELLAADNMLRRRAGMSERSAYEP